MQASIGQYSMQAGEPAQPVQQSVVIASMRGRFLRAALPSPCDIGQCFSTISNIRFVCPVRLRKRRAQIEIARRKLGADKADSNIALLISSTICVIQELYLPVVAARATT